MKKRQEKKMNNLSGQVNYNHDRLSDEKTSGTNGRRDEQKRERMNQRDVEEAEEAKDKKGCCKYKGQPDPDFDPTGAWEWFV